MPGPGPAASGHLAAAAWDTGMYVSASNAGAEADSMRQAVVKTGPITFVFREPNFCLLLGSECLQLATLTQKDSGQRCPLKI
jgi:hypothetical protein